MTAGTSENSRNKYDGNEAKPTEEINLTKLKLNYRSYSN